MEATFDRREEKIDDHLYAKLMSTRVNIPIMSAVIPTPNKYQYPESEAVGEALNK